MKRRTETMPMYDYQCRNCDHEFEEALRMDNRKNPTRRKCRECGRKMISQVISKSRMATVDSVNIGMTKPDATYSEVIDKINERTGIKGTRYEVQDRLSGRTGTYETVAGKRQGLGHLTKYQIKREVRDALK
jgi:putative FmdB family regulatory protein